MTQTKSLLEHVNEAVAAQNRAKEALRAREEEYLRQQQQEEVQLRSAVMGELEKLVGTKTPYGTFSVERTVSSGDHREIFAFLLVGSRRIGWFRSNVVRDTYDDGESPLIQFIEPRVWYCIHGPESPKDRRLLLDDRSYGGWRERCSRMKDLPGFFGKMAFILAKWFETP